MKYDNCIRYILLLRILNKENTVSLVLRDEVMCIAFVHNILMCTFLVIITMYVTSICITCIKLFISARIIALCNNYSKVVTAFGKANSEVMYQLFLLTKSHCVKN